MKAQTVIVGVAALAIGAALGYFTPHVLGGRDASPAPDAAETPAPEKQADDTELKALRRQVKALQAKLAARAEEKTETAVAVETPVEEPRAERGRGGDWRERFEQWKKENPEEFAKMEKRRQEFMQRRAERAKSRLDFLASIDTSKMTAEEKATHEKLQGLLAKREELEGQMGQMLELSDDERNQLFADMHETHRAINELNGQEREALFRQMAGELGVQGEDASLISATISEIISATDGGFGGPGPGGPGGFGRGIRHDPRRDRDRQDGHRPPRSGL